MAWIQLHQSASNHRKVLTLAGILQIEDAHALGLCCNFWLWALDNAPDGRLDGTPNAVLAQAAHWHGDVDAWVGAMETARLFDRDGAGLSIHDWEEYAGRLIDKRRANVARTQAWRKAKTPAVMHNERTTNAYVMQQEKSREEKSNTPSPDGAGVQAAPTTAPRTGNSETRKRPPVCLPTWLEPLKKLEGYRNPGLRTVDLIRMACERRGVDASEVVQEFASFWPEGKLRFRNWHEPVSSLRNTIDIQIDKHVEWKAGRNGKSSANPPEDKYAKQEQWLRSLRGTDDEQRQSSGGGVSG